MSESNQQPAQEPEPFVRTGRPNFYLLTVLHRHLMSREVQQAGDEGRFSLNLWANTAEIHAVNHVRPSQRRHIECQFAGCAMGHGTNTDEFADHGFSMLDSGNIMWYDIEHDKQYFGFDAVCRGLNLALDEAHLLFSGGSYIPEAVDNPTAVANRIKLFYRQYDKMRQKLDEKLRDYDALAPYSVHERQLVDIEAAMQ